MADGRFSYDDILLYLDRGVYPEGFLKKGKSALRKRSKFFVVTDGILYYVGKTGKKYR